MAPNGKPFFDNFLARLQLLQIKTDFSTRQNKIITMALDSNGRFAKRWDGRSKSGRYYGGQGAGFLDTFLERGRRWDSAQMRPNCMGLGLARTFRDESTESDGPGAWGKVKPRVSGVLGWVWVFCRSSLSWPYLVPMVRKGQLWSYSRIAKSRTLLSFRRCL